MVSNLEFFHRIYLENFPYFQIRQLTLDAGLVFNEKKAMSDLEEMIALETSLAKLHVGHSRCQSKGGRLLYISIFAVYVTHVFYSEACRG